MTIDDLMDALMRMRAEHGNVAVELYDQDTWLELPEITVEWSSAPECVLICGRTRTNEE